MDTGFIMWSFQGKLLFRNPPKLDKFCQLLWRPRPPSLLTAEDIAVSTSMITKLQPLTGFEHMRRLTNKWGDVVSCSYLNTMFLSMEFVFGYFVNFFQSNFVTRVHVCIQGYMQETFCHCTMYRLQAEFYTCMSPSSIP